MIIRENAAIIKFKITHISKKNNVFRIVRKHKRVSQNVKVSSLSTMMKFIHTLSRFLRRQVQQLPIKNFKFFIYYNFQAISIWARRVIECPPKVLFKSLYSTRLAPWSRCLWSCMTCRICLQIRKHFCDKERFTCPRKESTKLTCRNGCAIWSISGTQCRKYSC